MTALSILQVDDSLGELMSLMLKSTIINSKLGETFAKRYVSKGTLQGGVLSPLLRNLVVNELLIYLEAGGNRMIAYADDFAIAALLDLNTNKKLFQLTLNRLTRWADRCSLGTYLFLFFSKYKIPIIDTPSINGTSLVFSDIEKYLGPIFDRKQNWKPNTQEISQES